MGSLKSLDLARTILKFVKSVNIGFVEIGVYDGKNAKIIGQTLSKAGKDCFYVGFDLFDKAAEFPDLSRTNPGVYDQLKNDPAFAQQMSIKKIAQLLSGYYDPIHLVAGDIRKTLTENLHLLERANVFFIDGPHTKEDVSRDYNIIEKTAKAGSLIVIDDPHIPGIGEFVRTLRRKIINITGSVAVVK